MSSQPGTEAATEAITCAFDTEQHVARITLHRADHGNTMTAEMARACSDFLDRIDDDDDIKAVLIRSSGADLSAGWAAEDAWQMYIDAPGGSVKKIPSQRARLIALNDLWWGPRGIYGRLLRCRKVTIVEAVGRCFDAGLYLTLCSDLVLAAPDARFGNPRWALVGVDQDMSLLVATVGLKRAKALMFTGATWTADQALRFGLVDRVVDSAHLGAEVEALGRACASIMRDGIVSEKYAVFASLEKMGIGHGFATATVVGASMSNLHFQPGEFNFLREMRDHGAEAAFNQAELARQRGSED